MERLEEAPVILGLPSTSRKAGAKHRKRVRPILIVHLRRHALRPPIRSETYESCLIQPRNPKNLTHPKFVHTAYGDRSKLVVQQGVAVQNTIADRDRALSPRP
jgi:hypothetical protein